jgi:flagellar basal-body rod protein FlgG
VDTLKILVPDPQNNNQTKQSLNALSQPTGQGAFTGRIVSGQLERSNVDVGEEMAAMMAASRAFQSCAQVVKILDAVNQKTVSEIGRV